MSNRSQIEWTDATWNPVTGCTKVSAGCTNCYAETFAERWRGIPGHHFKDGFDLRMRPARLAQPLGWRAPRRVFVNSMSDLFHDGVPDEYIASVFAVMIAAPQHTFQVLTKRHARMRALLTSHDFALTAYKLAISTYRTTVRAGWPLPNVWLGVSVENQQWADIRVPALLDTPAAVRFLSAEPLLGPVDLTAWLKRPQIPARERCRCTCHPHRPAIDWVITGGESGPRARPAHPGWFRSLRDQCRAGGVAYFHKQHGAYTWQLNGPDRAPDLYVNAFTGHTCDPGDVPVGGGWEAVWRVGKKAAGRVLDGRTWDGMPERGSGSEAA
ncbi:DUF5131 family protein [Actinomadura rudentiformis]|uniref:Phage Gp37/Gp68 family protein n=1 Tax=Actinomadura rudentiformis TaxID=359158 RepID=A0A6H9YQ52_9ACTN|nr:phage Gp37/Gp68 family protein [Actinomadura rudentiformis]KAB2347258.1 phage Gp37/Gp68 family protein [Actinomadura rudentiformis]